MSETKNERIKDTILQTLFEEAWGLTGDKLRKQAWDKRPPRNALFFMALWQLVNACLVRARYDYHTGSPSPVFRFRLTTTQWLKMARAEMVNV